MLTPVPFPWFARSPDSDATRKIRQARTRLRYRFGLRAWAVTPIIRANSTRSGGPHPPGHGHVAGETRLERAGTPATDRGRHLRALRTVVGRGTRSVDRDRPFALTHLD